MPGRIFTREFKLDLVRQLESGQKRLAQLCREYNLDQSLLSRWRGEFRQRGENAFLPKQSQELSVNQAFEQRIAELERHCGQLSLENALLKKLVTKLQSRSATP
jgi:transposase-like protein